MSLARLQPFRRWARATAAWSAVVLLAGARPAHAQSVWELTPYRVQVVVAAARAPELTARLQSDLAEGLVERVNAVIGAAWDVDVLVAPPPLRRAMLDDLESVAVESLPEESIASEPFDKVFLVTVAPGDPGYDVSVRELDVRTRQWGNVARVPAWQAAKLRDAAFQGIHNAFSPLAQIVSVDEDAVVLRLRAGGFPPRDGSVRTVQPGDLFRPVIRHNERSGKLRGVNAIDWTFLTVDAIAPTGVRCRLDSGFRSPISGRRRGRFEQLALGVLPSNATTKLTLQARTAPHQPLAGYDVYSHAPGSKTTEWIGRSDRGGSLEIGPGEPPLRILLVKHGTEFLARLPMVPGLRRALTAQIANDDQRLEAEGFVTGLQEELIDLVTRREVLLAQARRSLANRELDRAGELIRQVRSLDTREDFSLYLSQEKAKIFSPDKLVQAKINSMFNKTQRLVNQYLDPAPIDQLAGQLHQARTAGTF